MAIQINSLKDLKIDKILTESLKKSPNEYDFAPLAKEIMNKICISNGAHIYRPIEIEFYIYDKKEHADIHVYPRDNKKAGDIFFHLSGMDICFESSFEETEGTIRFGGILIRALEREDGKRFGGPLTCKDEVLNNASKKCRVRICNTFTKIEANNPINRKGINQSKTLFSIDKYCDASYRFFISSFNIGDEIQMKYDTFNFKNQEIQKDRISTYKIKK